MIRERLEQSIKENNGRLLSQFRVLRSSLEVRLCSHWSSSYISALSLVDSDEIFSGEAAGEELPQ